jgi:iron(III) transport system substrate-binding protein
MAERRAQKYLWDICLCGTATAFRVFYQGKHLDPVKPILILPEVLDQSNWLSGKHHYLDPEEKYIFVFLGNASQALSFNKNLLNPAEFKSYWDLLAPKWKGKIVVRDPRAPGSGGGQTRFLYYHPKIGPQYLIRLFTEMEPVLTRDDSQALEWLAKGKVALCFFCRGDQVTKAQRQGLPVDSFPPGWKEGESLQASFGTISLMNRAPHPNAAKVYINWFLSRDGQKTFQEIMNRPPTSAESLRTDIPKDVVPQDQRRRDGIEYVMADQSEWLEMEPIYKLVNEALVKVARERASK